jgi:hypothetical protein
MASYAEMKRIAESAPTVRGIATHMLALDDMDWTDWELDFLEHMAVHDGPEPLSMRQREKLVELRDRSEMATDHRGIAVRHLIEQCWLARLELEEDDEAFVAGLHRTRPAALRRGTLHRLVRCAVRVGLIERHLAPAARVAVDVAGAIDAYAA